MAKHPVAISIPLAKVEEAVVEMMFSASACIPFPNVEVALPPTFRMPLMVVLPVLEIEKSVEVANADVDEPIAKSVVGVG